MHPVRALLSRWQGWVIAIVLGVQILLPLRYYLGRHDPHDERYAWRMFSPMRMTTCQPQFFKDDVPVALAGEFHEAWIEIAKRGRFEVLEAMGARLCAKYPRTAIRVQLTCSYLDQPTHMQGGFDLCEIPEL